MMAGMMLPPTDSAARRPIMVAPPRLLTIEARWDRARQATLIAVLALVAAFVDPDRPLGMDVCLWKRLTGWPWS